MISQKAVSAYQGKEACHEYVIFVEDFHTHRKVPSCGKQVPAFGFYQTALV